MAATALTPISVPIAGGTTSGTLYNNGTVDVSNGNILSAQNRFDRLLFLVQANGTAGTLTVVAGTDDRLTFRGKLGNSAISIAIGEQAAFVVEAARHATVGNDIHLSYSNLNAAGIVVLKLPAAL